MNRILPLVAAVALVAVAIMWWTSDREPSASGTGGGALAVVTVPELTSGAEAGKAVYDAKCANCHGAKAAGVDGKGPPLVHKIYEPGHHGDFAFLRAVAEGARQHHWKFGDMEPVKGVSEADTNRILVYVRELQRANGIN